MNSIGTSAGGYPGRLLRWTLLASLALNVFFIGASATHAVRNQIDTAGHFKPGLKLDAMVETLPPADGAKLRAALDADMDKVGVALSAYRNAQARARAALNTEPFDSPAFDQALADIRTKRQVLQQTLQAVVSKAAPGMSPAGRKQLADWTGVKSSS
ncbi:MAG: periplasmic heavy metal sensor [Alphaproteobacteria bacterium]|nr:periplasmic heavy metal sensor [Alphaproteobacteria bacterium]